MTTGRASRLQGLEAFVKAVEAGGFAPAARALGITRSAVAKSVNRLESHLGTALFVRAGRTLQLTPEGQGYYERVVRAFEELDAAEATLSNQQRDVAGSLSVSLPVSFGRRWIVPALLELAENHPRLRLDLSFTDRFVAIDEEGVDLAVRIGADRETGDLKARMLATQEAFLCAAPGYIERFGVPQSIEDLHAHGCINFAQNGRVLPWRLRDETDAIVKVLPPGPHVISHGDAMLDAVLSGRGIARLPEWLVAEPLREGRLVQLLSDTVVEEQPIRLIWPERRTRHRRVRLAIDALVGKFTPVPPWQMA